MAKNHATGHAVAIKQPLPWGGLFSVAVVFGFGLLYFRAWYFAHLDWPRTVFRSESQISERVLDMWHFGSISAIGIISIIIGFIVWRYMRFSLLVRRATWYTLLISVPLFIFSLFFCVALAIFGFPEGMSVMRRIDKYDVGILQTFDFDTYASTTLWFVVVREDNWYYAEVLESAGDYFSDRYTVCNELSALRQHQRVYFLCDNEIISEHTPYLDTNTNTIFIGWGKSDQEQLLSELPFEVPVTPPRVVQKAMQTPRIASITPSMPAQGRIKARRCGSDPTAAPWMIPHQDAIRSRDPYPSTRPNIACS